jgi:hypothetical protein
MRLTRGAGGKTEQVDGPDARRVRFSFVAQLQCKQGTGTAEHSSGCETITGTGKVGGSTLEPEHCW